MNGISLETLISVLIVLIILSGFFSGSETAMMSLNRYRLKHLIKKNHRGAIRASKMLEQPDRLIGLILIGNNLVNNAAAAISAIIALELYGDAGVAIGTFIVTLVMLIISEVTPKTIAAYHPETVAFPATLILKPLMWISTPVVWTINYTCRQLVKPFGIKLSQRADHVLSGEELRSLVGEGSVLIPDRHTGMLVNILDLDDVTVDDIMVPRNEIYGIDLAADDSEIIERLLACGYTRVPVYEGEINNILGIFHLRKAAHLFQNTDFSKAALRDMIREPYFLPENTPLHTQLHHFQKEKRRIGIVVDEYGEVQGLVTLEDILEEIVGEFTSNIADNIEEIKLQEDGTYIIDGSTSIRDLNKSLNWNLPTDGPRTLNGLILEHLESFPDARTSVSLAAHHFEILEIANNKIKTVKASVAASGETETSHGH